jgi:hypothetical protein
MNPLKKCGCKQCRYGLHQPFGKCVMKRVTRRFRHATKVALRKGIEPPWVMSVPYTD